jgi:hypothetical protein
MRNGGRREALPQHTTSVIVNEIVISKDDGPCSPHPAREPPMSAPHAIAVDPRVRCSHFHRKAWPQAVRVVLSSLGPQFLCILESVENDHMLAHEVNMNDVSWRRFGEL